MRSILPLFVGVSLAIAAPRSPAQDRLWTALGDNDFDWFGYTVRVVGDLNGDGMRDVGAARYAWYVRLFDGPSGAKLFDVSDRCEVYGPIDSADFDGDGTADVLFSMWCASVVKWKASVLSGANRKEICRVIGSAATATGDVNGDGASDFVVHYFDPITYVKDLRVHSGPDGSLLLTLAPAGRSSFGYRGVVAAGDWNGDGTPDLVVTDEPPPTGLGSILIFSLADGSLLYASSTNYKISSTTGHGIVPLGDVDADGIVDYLIVDRDESTSRFPKAGVVRLLSGATLTEIARIEGKTAKEGLDILGTCGDVDGDGVEDFVLGPTGASLSCVTAWVHSGATRRRLYAVQSEELYDDYITVSGGDLDGDGLAEIVSGHRDVAAGGLGRRGMVVADRGRRVFLTAAPSLRDRFRSSVGVRAAGDTWFQFFAANCKPGSAVSLDLVEADGVPTGINLAIGLINGFGEWGTSLKFDPGDTNVHTYGVQLTGVDRSGNAVTTAIERFGYR